MAKTLEEVLRETGLTDEQITALDGKVKAGLTAYASSANESLEKAELAVRAQREAYDREIAPALNKWANETAEYQAREAAYKAALNAAKDGGFQIPAILNDPNPNPQPGRTADGKFVANANPVPGSPQFDSKKLIDDVANFNVFVADTSWKYRTLFGKELPDSPSNLVREATAQRMSPADYAAKKYGFSEKETAMKAADEKAKIDAAVKDAVDKNTRDLTERFGSNPNVRTPSESAFSSVNKAVTSGQRKDPLKLTAEERTANTHATIQKEFAERSSTVQ